MEVRVMAQARVDAMVAGADDARIAPLEVRAIVKHLDQAPTPNTLEGSIERPLWPAPLPTCPATQGAAVRRRRPLLRGSRFLDGSLSLWAPWAALMADIKHNFAARVASTKIFSASLDSWLDTTSSISSFVLAESPLTVVSVSGPRSSLCRCRRCKKLSRFDRFVLALLRASGRPPSGRGDGSHRNADKVAGIGRRGKSGPQRGAAKAYACCTH